MKPDIIKRLSLTISRMVAMFIHVFWMHQMHFVLFICEDYLLF